MSEPHDDDGIVLIDPVRAKGQQQLVEACLVASD